jgi:hypothetical protein
MKTDDSSFVDSTVHLLGLSLVLLLRDDRTTSKKKEDKFENEIHVSRTNNVAKREREKGETICIANTR